MRILLDATAIPADRGGVGRYVDELASALVAAGVDLVVGCQARDADYYGAMPGIEVAEAPRSIESTPRRLAWEQTQLPQLVRRTRADLLHCPHYTMPTVPGRPTVVTLHDATFFSHPDAHTPLKRHFFRSATKVAVRRAAALVVPSAATRDEVLRYAGGDTERFHVAPHGVDRAQFHPVDASERARVSASLGLAGVPYVGFLGTLEPRKNVPALIRAWVSACAGRAEPPALVLAGGKGWDTAIDAAVAEVPAGLRLVRAGYLPLDDLPGFLSGARVLAYPSLGEGFGLPVLEAMSCGATVLTTKELSLSEVGGDAVAYCQTDEADIARTLTELLDDDARRASLRAAALERAREFTWERSARVHIDAYEAALRTR